MFREQLHGLSILLNLDMAWQVLTFYFYFSFVDSIPLQYSILEELRLNSIIGNVAEDLGLNSSNLKMRKLRIVSPHNRNYFNISSENGNLYVSDRIDREEICGSEQSCFLENEILAENPINVFPLKIEVRDVNDNPPSFSKDSFTVKISESASPGALFILGNVRDPDLGSNSLQGYSLSPNSYFSLVEKSEPEKEYPELILLQSVDREKQQNYELTLTAFDEGKPSLSGTATVRIVVQDINDNYPVFSQKIYKVSLDENLPPGSVVLHMVAVDKDEGSNAEISYSFSHIPDNAKKVFTMDSQTGLIQTKGELDYETTQTYEMTVEAADGGGLVAQSSVFVQIVDLNDNAPEITIASLSTPIPEDSAPGTLVALINVKDLDSGKYGEVNCHITDTQALKLVPSSNSYYKLVTAGPLDRETTSEYNITIIAEDEGSLPMVSNKIVHITVSDMNDNPPVFGNPFYISYIQEHTPAGTSIQSIHASDLDENENARVTYSIINKNIDDIPVTSYVSINSMTGVLYAQRSFDYEQLREFEFQVNAKDSGSPPLSSNVTVRICIIDKNDNAPKILYPSADTEGSALFEFIPHSAEKGYLVTKVIAVDADSGHNAWLSYHLLQVPDPSLLTIGQYNGEIRIGRDLPDIETLRQKIVVLVKDNGVPSLSSTVTLNLVVAENFQQVVPEIRPQPNTSGTAPSTTFYLIIAIALITVLFIVTVLIVVLFKCRKNPMTSFDAFNRNVYPQFTLGCPSEISDTSLPFPFSYDVCVTLDSKQNEIAYLKPVQNVPTENLIDTEEAGLGTDSRNVSLSTSNNVQV